METLAGLAMRDLVPSFQTLSHSWLINGSHIGHLLCDAWWPSGVTHIGVRAGGARGAAAPPNFGQLRFFGQQEKIWAKPFFKDVSVFF